MDDNGSSECGISLERSCAKAHINWLHSAPSDMGVEFLEAWLHGPAYHKHRHDSYALCLTTGGVQVFDYRGATRVSLAGQVVVLHPDELHDGRAGTDEGFGYRLVYVQPALISAVLRALTGRTCALPFVRDPVTRSSRLSAAISNGFCSTREPLALEDLVVEVAEGLLEADPSGVRAPTTRRVHVAAVERARALLDAETTCVVHSSELEAVTGLDRYELARQFRAVCGTSPYRYSLMRRLASAREQIAKQRPLAEVALESGFADQSHLTRMFRATYGLTPARYRALRAQ